MLTSLFEAQNKELKNIRNVIGLANSLKLMHDAIYNIQSYYKKSTRPYEFLSCCKTSLVESSYIISKILYLYNNHVNERPIFDVDHSYWLELCDMNKVSLWDKDRITTFNVKAEIRKTLTNISSVMLSVESDSQQMKINDLFDDVCEELNEALTCYRNFSEC